VETLKGVKALAVIERMDNPAAQSNPLTMELKAAFADALTGQPGYPAIAGIPRILSGAAGLGSRDVRPEDLVAVVDALIAGRREFFSLNIVHPSALEPAAHPDVRPRGAFSLRGYSIGGFGSVTANKVIATVAAELFGLRVQAYPKYGSEKKGLPTNYYLTLAPERIRTHCEMEQAEFIPLNTASALSLGNPLRGLSRGGTVFVQWSDSDGALWERFPLAARHSVRMAGARVFHLDAARIAREETPRADLEVRMQGIALLGVFLRCAPFRERAGLTEAALMAKAEEALRHAFGRASDAVIAANLRCAQRGYRDVRELPPERIAASAGEVERAFGGRAVADVMHRGVITCAPDEPLSQVAGAMTARHISAIVVVNPEREMEGILSTTDLARAAQLAGNGHPELPLTPRHLMTREVAVTWPGEPLPHAVERMLARQVHRLVVVKSEQEPRVPVGILSMSDLAGIEPDTH
jgi:pyruvate-ferredoxin/flavodoxin oxidoreductase